MHAEAPEGDTVTPAQPEQVVRPFKPPYIPAAQTVQLPDPEVGEYEPKKQASQLEPEVENVPPGQLVHKLPPAVDVVPAAHTVHETEVLLEENVPASQIEHC